MLTFFMGWFFGVISAAIFLAWYRITTHRDIIDDDIRELQRRNEWRGL